jgi:hypothetical protein
MVPTLPAVQAAIYGMMISCERDAGSYAATVWSSSKSHIGETETTVENETINTTVVFSGAFSQSLRFECVDFYNS